MECPELLLLKKYKNIIILYSDLLQIVSKKKSIYLIVSKYIWENSTRNLRTYDDCEDEEQLLTNDSPNIDVQKDY